MEQMQQITENPAVSEYIAFISYRHKPLDKEAAERIQKAIERYTVPKEYREQVGGKRLGKVFRDEDELPISSSLSDSITYALDHSKYLIVVCTPDLPKSAWCEQEIRYFTGKYGRDRVIAVLADGNPSESFSPLLLHTFDEAGNITGDTEPLAANIAGKNHTIDRGAFRKEIVRVYAALIGCPFDALWQRERRRKMNQTFALLGVTTLLLAGFSAYVLSKNAQITAKNEQITAQNEQITEQYDQISKQNEQITEQNEQIVEQNSTLQKQLSSMKVDAGYAALEKYDVLTALQNGIDALVPGEEGEELYDRRVRALFADALGAYDYKSKTPVLIYQQTVPITQMLALESESRLLFVDEAGVVRCIEAPSGKLVWERQLRYTLDYDKDCEIILPSTNDSVLCKGSDFVETLSLENGETLWRYDYVNHGMYGYASEGGTGLRGLSPDGKTLVLLDGEPEKDEKSILIILDTADGKEITRIDLAAENQRIVSKRREGWYYNTVDFSEDGKRLVVMIFSQLLDENGEDKLVDGTDSKEHRCDYYLIDTDSWEILQHNYMNRFFSYGTSVSYGCAIEPETYNLFCAQYRSEFGGIVINTMDWEKEEYNSTTVTQTFPAEDGFFTIDSYFKETVPLRASGNRVMIPSGDTLFLLERNTRRLVKAWQFSDKILDFWWNDDIGQWFTVLFANGITASYDLQRGWETESYGPSGVKYAQTFSNGVFGQELFDENSDGAVFLVLRETPGSILMTKEHTNSGVSRFPGQPDQEVIYALSSSFQLSPSGNRLFAFYYVAEGGYTVVVYDPVTFEVIGQCDTPKTYNANPCVVDDTHFIMKNVIYGFDGTQETLRPQNGVSKRAFEYKDECESRILSNGQLLTVSRVLAGETGMTYCWLDGKAIEIDPKAGQYISETPKSGNSGLVVALSTGENRDLTVLDAFSGELTKLEDPYPQSDRRILAIGSEKKVFAYSDAEQITVYDMETMKPKTLDYGYAAGEINSLCFVPGDEYLLIYTVAGRIDCWQLADDTLVYSSTYDRKVYYNDVMECQTNDQDGEIYVFLKSSSSLYGDWIGIDRKNWTQFASGGTAFCYLPQRSEIIEFKNIRSKNTIMLQKVYSLQELENLAREEIASHAE